MTATFRDNMLESTRLTRSGQLIEATALLQAMLSRSTQMGSVGQASEQTRRPKRQNIIDLVPQRVEEPGCTAPSDYAATPAQPSSLPRELWRGATAVHSRMPDGLRGLVAPLQGLPTMPQWSGGSSAKSQPQTIPAGATFDEHLHSNASGNRAYKLYVPSALQAKSPALIVMLHGCTQSPDDFAAGTQMNTLAEEHGFLVAYPAQPQSANASKCWNWFNAADQERDSGEPALLAGITRQIMDNHAVDPSRVYIAGLSAGGAAAAIMGAKYPDLYAAVGIHSGLACGAARDMPSAFAAMQRGASATGSVQSGTGGPVRAIVFHGDSDRTVNPTNGEQVFAQFSGAAVALRSETSRGDLGGLSYTKTVQAEADGKPVFEHWLIHGAAHAWSGGSSSGSYTETRGPDASREMVRFFLSSN